MATRLEFITRGKVQFLRLGDGNQHAYLDTGSIETLDGILKDYEGATIVISKEVETEDEVLAKGFNETVREEVHTDAASVILEGLKVGTCPTTA